MNKGLAKIHRIFNSPLSKSMIISTLCKPLSMIVSFLYTPILLNYLGEESYGIWATILSVVNWINYFDVGIGNGLRNQLTKDICKRDKAGINYSVSTAYVLLSFISGILLVIGTIVMNYIDCYRVFNTTINIRPALSASFIFICINFVLALSKVQLYALQQAEQVGIMTVLNQILNLTGISIINCFSKGNIFFVAIIVGLSGFWVNILFSFKIWRRNKELIPVITSFRTDRVKCIGNQGIRFFLIQIAGLVLFTTDNMIITQILGPSYVTPYHTVYAAFGLVNGVFAAMMAPLWSKYTVAKEKNDFKWIKKIIIRLDMLLIPVCFILILGITLFKPISVIWLKKSLNYDYGLILAMGIYYFIYIWSSIYAGCLNGMGKINLQMYLAVFTAILNIPLSIFLGKYVGMQSTGVLLATIICMLITVIPLTINVHIYLNQKLKHT